MARLEEYSMCSVTAGNILILCVSSLESVMLQARRAVIGRKLPYRLPEGESCFNYKLEN